jgi:hypothetical protein
MRKQTAVEWLVSELKLEDVIKENDLIIVSEVIKQAKAMQKLNIYMAYLEGHRKDFNSKDEALFLMREYYNETYGD